MAQHVTCYGSMIERPSAGIYGTWLLIVAHWTVHVVC